MSESIGAAIITNTHAEIAPFDPEQLGFVNVNTPEDLETAREIAAWVGCDFANKRPGRVLPAPVLTCTGQPNRWLD